MATSLQTTTIIDRRSVYRDEESLSRPANVVKFDRPRSFTTGIGDNLANTQYETRVELAPAAFDDYDLRGVLLDVYGNVIDFKEIKELYIINLGVFIGTPPIDRKPDSDFSPTAGEDLLIGGAGAAANAWPDLFNGNPDAQLTLPSGGQFEWTAPLDGGLPVIAGSDVLRITNDGTVTFTYDIIIAGVQ